jgi:hypothetical protein
MTQKQFLKKLKSMNVDIRHYIEKEALRLFRCGGVDTVSFGDDYTLPKICLHVALGNCAKQYSPLGPEAIKAARNLKHF